ncbi:MAG: N-acetylmuramoyl-L-alanine amidase family protein [Actinomycetota bacterium]
MMRLSVAVLFLVSVLSAAVVDIRQDDDRADRVAAGTTTTSTTAAPTTTAAAPATTTTAATTAAAPPATEAPTTLPPATPAPTAAPAAPPPAADAKVLVSPRGVVLPVTGREGAGYRVTTPCGRSAVLHDGTPVTGATVVLDAGHGGVEPGAVGPGGLAEKGLNLEVVEHARNALEKAGVRTILTRTADYRITLVQRAAIVKALDPEAFVSVHHNAEPDGPFPKPGSETYYQVASAQSKRLAGLVYEEVVKALAAYPVPWVADTDAGAKYRTNVDGDDYYGILRRTQGVPAALAELGFVSNPPEEALFTRADVRQVEGEAVARGVLRFLTTRDPGSGFTVPYPRESPAGGGGGASNCQDPEL